MKTIIKFICLLFAALLLFASCAQNNVIAPTTAPTASATETPAETPTTAPTQAPTATPSDPTTPDPTPTTEPPGSAESIPPESVSSDVTPTPATPLPEVPTVSDLPTYEGEHALSDLMAGICAEDNPLYKEIDDAFVNARMNFDLKLLSTVAAQNKGENSLISPLALYLSLAMTANGADGQTRAQFEELLGLPVDELNAYLRSYIHSLPTSDKCRLLLANSLWIKDDGAFEVYKEFLQKNADNYGAEVYSATFDAETLDAMNAWINEQTEGMIERLVENFKKNDVLLLLNALTFRGEWQLQFWPTTPYYYPNYYTFTNYNGVERYRAWCMEGEVYFPYFVKEDAMGVRCPLVGDRYSFIAILPEEGVDVYDYLAGLDAQKLRTLFDGAYNTDPEKKPATLALSMPVFEVTVDNDLVKVLKKLGLTDAFDPLCADFSRISETPLYLGNVEQKATISVDEKGVAASAAGEATALTFGRSDALYINRPFIYMIVDNETDLPLFGGVLADATEYEMGYDEYGENWHRVPCVEAP